MDHKTSRIIFILSIILTTYITPSLIFADSKPKSKFDDLIVGLPEDVISIMDRKVGCNYWMGEMPEKDDGTGRIEMIQKEILPLNCKTLKKDESVIRKKYSKDSKVLKAINESDNLTPSDR